MERKQLKNYETKKSGNHARHSACSQPRTSSILSKGSSPLGHPSSSTYIQSALAHISGWVEKLHHVPSQIIFTVSENIPWYSFRIYSDILVCSELGVIRNIGSMVASRSYLQRIWIPLRVSSQRIFIDNPPEICAPNSSARKPEQGFTMTEEVRGTCVWLTFKLSHSNNWTIVLLIIKVLTEWFPFSFVTCFINFLAKMPQVVSLLGLPCSTERAAWTNQALFGGVQQC